jgi:alpha-ketoglutarate-dependent taurine dioxygenase
MKTLERQTSAAARLRAPIRKGLQPKAISMSPETLVKAATLQPDSLLPLVVEPAVNSLNLIDWARGNREFIERELLKHGAILFRNFNLRTVADFESFTAAISGELILYRERSSPRHEVGERVYTSTDYPEDQKIFPHNEHSYSRTLPLKLFFFCRTPAPQGGQTPIADCRRILQRISPRTREKFIEKKWQYVRNFGHGFGLPWETVFQTDDKTVVEEYCRKAAIEVEWRDGNRLRTRQVRPAIALHPRTGDLVWFNHATFFHVSTLDPTMRAVLLSEFKDADLPNNTYYGDGSPIEPEVLDELREAYLAELVTFEWQQGDVVLLDNLLTAHSRNSYVGPREVLFAMADQFTRADV